ncbi:hypothetical protein MAUB1S_11445 [Mycolicibacterium aubagnense]
MMPLTPESLAALRAVLGFNQTEMANRIGLGLRAYQDLEGNKSTIRKTHILAIERVVLSEAARQANLGLLPPEVMQDVLVVVKLIRSAKQSAGL